MEKQNNTQFEIFISILFVKGFVFLIEFTAFKEGREFYLILKSLLNF